MRVIGLKRNGRPAFSSANGFCAVVLALSIAAALSAHAQAPAAPDTQPPPAQTPAAQPPAAPTQDTAPPLAGDQAVSTIRVGVNEVNQIFTVTDKNGHFITGLSQESFALLDNGMDPVSVVKFTQQANLPLRVGIMLDISSSISQRFQFEKESAIEFLLSVVRPNDRAFVEGFDVQVNVAQGYTNNIDLLNQGITKLRPGGGTALFDALYRTCNEQMLTLRDPFAVRKALILLSDGDDNYSHVLESEAIKKCQQADTIVFAISTNVSPSKDKGDDVLKQIAEATGGQAFYPTRIEQVANGFAKIEEELRSQYLLVYRPANFKQDGSFRTILLRAKDPRYKVRARQGYFAPKLPQ